MTLILTGNRASGKTYNLLNIASAQNIPVLVASKERKNILQEYAKKLNITVDIINIKEIDPKSYIKECAIDELETFIGELLGRHIIIDCCTVQGGVVNLTKERCK